MLAGLPTTLGVAPLDLLATRTNLGAIERGLGRRTEQEVVPVLGGPADDAVACALMDPPSR
jgi:hypothetical protein